jgi:ATP-dependent DNA ligase
MLFGELYWGEGKAGALYDFLSHQKDDNLKFAIFDAYNPALSNATYEDRREWLTSNVYPHLKNSNVGVIKPFYIEDNIELERLIASNREDGFEGIVVKNRDSMLFNSTTMIETQLGWVKVKHSFTSDCVVVEIDPQLERMEVDCNGRRVGVKLVNKYKPFVHVGNTVEVEHMGVLVNGGLRHPVFRGKVVKS